MILLSTFAPFAQPMHADCLANNDSELIAFLTLDQLAESIDGQLGG